MRFRDRLARFFYGRNGIDQLYYGLLVLFLILVMLQRCFIGNRTAALILNLLSWAVLIYMLFRSLSRNITARRRENAVFLSAFGKVKSFFILQKNKIRDRKSFVYKKCPHCGATLRLPRTKGSHTVKCPRCADRFEVKVRL